MYWGAPLSIACSTVATCSSTSYVTLTRRAASSACSSVSAATAATGSPWYLHSAPGVFGSFQTSAARTPGARCAALRSTAVTRACGCGERTILPKIMPGRLMSKLYLARPVTLSGPSRRFTRVLSTAGLGGHAYFFALAVGPGAAGGGAPRPSCALATGHPPRRELAACGHRGLHDADEGAAAADVAVEALLHLFGCRLRMFLDERDGRHHESR